jgi:PadR family transcriptional regulator PadR
MAKGELLGDFEQVVLLAIVRLEDEAYGVSIRRTIEEIAGRAVTVGAIYTTLDRLEHKGFVSSRMAEPTSERGGRAKRFFKLEARGATVLRNSLRSTRSMLRGLDRQWALL